MQTSLNITFKHKPYFFLVWENFCKDIILSGKSQISLFRSLCLTATNATIAAVEIFRRWRPIVLFQCNAVNTEAY